MSFMACCVWVGDEKLRKAQHPCLTRNGHSTLPQRNFSQVFQDGFPDGIWNAVLSQQWDVLPLLQCPGQLGGDENQHPPSAWGGEFKEFIWILIICREESSRTLR